MPPAANSSAHTLDEQVSRPRSGMARPQAGHASAPWIVLAAALLAGCAASAPRLAPHQTGQPATDPASPIVVATSVPAAEFRRRPVLTKIMSLMGVPYAFNGTDTSGFDCSGFTSAVFASALQRPLPHSSQGQYALGVAIERDSLRFGDLVFFADGGDEPSHVGIYVGDGLFAHASVSLGVTVSLLESGYYKKRYLGARRLPP